VAAATPIGNVVRRSTDHTNAALKSSEAPHQTHANPLRARRWALAGCWPAGPYEDQQTMAEQRTEYLIDQ
jgi:hypothetical protein